MTDMTRDQLIDDIRDMAAKMDPNHLPTGLTKMRKAELVEMRAAVLEQYAGYRTAASAQLGDDEGWDDPTGGIAAPDGLGNLGDAEPQVYQGVMHEDPILQAQEAAAVSYDWAAEREDFSALATASERLGKGIEEIPPSVRAAAQALATVAWRGMTAVVRSMGRTVRGKVVATELRTPDEDGSGRVLLVVEHSNGAPGRKATRTLHRLVDVDFEPVTS